MRIKEVICRKIFNSGGLYSPEVKIITDVGSFISSAPEGTSRGSREYNPKSFSYSFKKLRDLKGIKLNSLSDLFSLEEELYKQRINFLPFSLAVLKALAKEKNVEPYQLFSKRMNKGFLLNKIVGGGKHSNMKPEFQEFLLTVTRGSLRKRLEKAYEFHRQIGEELKVNGKDLEGGWAVNLSNEKVLYVLDKFKDKGMKFGIDAAANSFFSNGYYKINGKKMKRKSYINYLIELAKRYDLFYIEDPVEENDPEGFREIKEELKNAYICGDDLTVSNPKYIKENLENINSVILKPNQIGSVGKLVEASEIAVESKLIRVVSHRSKETNDPILSDLFVGLNAEYMKIGLFGGERISKINRLLEIDSKTF